MFIAVVVVVFEKTVSVMQYFMPSITNGNIIVSTLVLRPENDSGQPGNNWVGRFAFSWYSIRVETQQILDRLVVELFSGRTVQIASFDSVGLQWSWAGHESTMIPADFIVSTMLCVWCRRKKGRLRNVSFLVLRDVVWPSFVVLVGRRWRPFWKGN